MVSVADVDSSLSQALLGGNATAMGLYGDLPVKISEGTTPDTVIRVSGKGITKLQSRTTKGDHYIHVKITFPSSVIPTDIFTLL